MNHLINKTNDDLNKAIESNFEDTTLAVVTLRKDLSETMKEESNRTMQISQDMNSNIENLKGEFKEEIDKNKEITEKKHEITEKKSMELFEKFRENESNIEELRQNLDSSVRSSKDELLNAIRILGLSES